MIARFMIAPSQRWLLPPPPPSPAVRSCRCRRAGSAAAGVDHGDVEVLQRRLLQALELDERLAVVEDRAQLVVLRVATGRAAPGRRSSSSTCRPRTCSARLRAASARARGRPARPARASTLLCARDRRVGDVGRDLQLDLLQLRLHLVQLHAARATDASCELDAERIADSSRCDGPARDSRCGTAS